MDDSTVLDIKTTAASTDDMCARVFGQGLGFVVIRVGREGEVVACRGMT